MHRKPLLDVLAAYVARHPEDADRVTRFRQFVEAHADCFERSCRTGHVTGSAWILSPERGRVLLTHHRKLGRWLQLGGHADGDPDPYRVALREAREESGLVDLTPFEHAEPPLPLDVDVHRIPARAAEPAHFHFDVRYLLLAGAEALRPTDESVALAWFDRAQLAETIREESILRMEHRTRLLLAGPSA